MDMRRQSGYALLLAFAPACEVIPTTTVRVADPSSVSIEVQTPHGRETLLAAGGRPEEVEIPRTSPPYGTTALLHASAMRQEGGGIALLCDACVGTNEIALPSGGGNMVLLGTTAEVVETLPNGNTRIHIQYPYYVPGGYRGRLQGPFIAFQADMTTPAGNAFIVTGDGLSDPASTRPGTNTCSGTGPETSPDPSPSTPANPNPGTSAASISRTAGFVIAMAIVTMVLTSAVVIVSAR